MGPMAKPVEYHCPSGYTSGQVQPLPGGKKYTGAGHIIRIASKSWYFSVSQKIRILLKTNTKKGFLEILVKLKVWTWKVWACTALNT